MIRTRPEVVKLAHLLQTLALQPVGYSDAAVITGMHSKTVTRHIKDLYFHGFVHVGEWGLDARGRPSIRRFRLGGLPDVPKPVSLSPTSTNRVRALRARKESP